MAQSGKKTVRKAQKNTPKNQVDTSMASQPDTGSDEEFWRYQHSIRCDGKPDFKVTMENLNEEERRRQIFHGYSKTWTGLPDDEPVLFTIDNSATWPSKFECSSSE